MWLCDVCVSLQHNKGCQASGFLFASLLCYHSPVSPNFLSHRMQITRPLFREVFAFFVCFFFFYFVESCTKELVYWQQSVIALFYVTGAKQLETQWPVFFALIRAGQLTQPLWFSIHWRQKQLFDSYPQMMTYPPPRVDFDPFPMHSRQVVLTFVPFHIRSIIKTQITELCWNWSWNVP